MYVEGEGCVYIHCWCVFALVGSISMTALLFASSPFRKGRSFWHVRASGQKWMRKTMLSPRHRSSRRRRDMSLLHLLILHIPASPNPTPLFHSSTWHPKLDEKELTQTPSIKINYVPPIAGNVKVHLAYFHFFLFTG